MKAELAEGHIKRRMEELGRGNNYRTRHRHFVLSPDEQRTIDGGTHLFVLIEEDDNCRVQSDVGVYDISETNANELHHEHQGKILLSSNSPFTTHIQMIQVITKS